MLRSYCFNCGGPQENPSANYCNTCTTNGNEAYEGVMKSGAEQIAAEADPDKKLQMQNVLENAAAQARREAMANLGHHARKNYVDPRTFMRTGPNPRK